MRSVIKPGERLDETLFLETGEDHIAAFWSLTFLADRANRGSVIKRFEGLGYEEYDVIRAKCEELKLDVLSGLSRSRRGYGETRFHEDDPVFINQAIDYLGQQTEHSLNDSERQKFLPYVAAAKLVGRTTLVDMQLTEASTASAA
ncbi:MAG TPA: hypothetical protein VHD60_01430 [Candidatus Saccharimonadales bacterium]|nr:hypothetical protein [Candidatus Saccharimonadales bacterium]